MKDIHFKLQSCFAIMMLATASSTILAGPTVNGGTVLQGCPLFPADNIWNTPINALPVDPLSDSYINTIGAEQNLHPDFGSGTWNGGPVGIPYNVVAGDQELVNVSFVYADESDSGPYPIPEDPLIEGGPDAAGDRHVLVLDKGNCILYELFDAHPNSNGSWSAGSGAIFNLQSHALRPSEWTSADAAGLPILPGLVRYDEVVSGEIHHAIRFTAPQTRREYIWPARHFASTLTGLEYPPMGQRFRLKSDYDISGFSVEVQTILRAFKKYGIILADNGAPWFISGVPDGRWNNDVLRELKQVTGSNFEAIDTSSLMIDPDSGQALQPIPSVGGTLSGMAPMKVKCINRTTGQQVTIRPVQDSRWDCEAAGLEVQSQDRVIIKIWGDVE